MMTETVEDTFEPTWWVAKQRTPYGVVTTYVSGDVDEMAWARAPGGPLDHIDEVEPIEDADLLRRLGEGFGTEMDGIEVISISTAMEYERGWTRG